MDIRLVTHRPGISAERERQGIVGTAQAAKADLNRRERLHVPNQLSQGVAEAAQMRDNQDIA